jgi:chemotaxis protein MotB
MARSDRMRRRGAEEEGEDGGERWLLTYSDMITLLMALFMVLFSISSVNISKFRTLQQALRAAFSGNVLPGGKDIAEPGATANSSRTPTLADIQSIVPLTTITSTDLENSPEQNPGAGPGAGAGAGGHGMSAAAAAAAQHQQDEFQQIKHQLETYAAKHGFSNDVHATIENRGLVIRVLTDKLLFPSGSATLDSSAAPFLSEIATLVNIDRVHPISVEGNTDDVPIHSHIFPSNWELSTARASAVVRYLIERSVNPLRLGAAGYADLRPVATNTTPQGRALNRRVQIVLQRTH